MKRIFFEKKEKKRLKEKADSINGLKILVNCLGYVNIWPSTE